MANQLTQIRGDRSVVVNISDGITRADSGDIARSFIGNDDSAQSRSQLSASGNPGGLSTLHIAGGSAAAGAVAWMMFGPGLMLAAVGIVGFLLWQSKQSAGKP